MTTQNTPAIIEKAKAVMPTDKQFLSANPYEMSFKQEYGFAIMAIQNNPYLLNCTPDSIKSAVISVALTGISLNPALKYAYLVPRNTKNGLMCVMDISYIGMIKILTDAGAVKSVDAEVVYENDPFIWSKGSTPKLDHSPDLLKERGKPVGAYAIAYFRDGGFQFEVMAKVDIEKVRATSESWKKEDTRQYSLWETWTDEMWKKTVLKRLFKILPKTKFSEQLIATLSKDHENEMADIDNKNEFLDSTFSDVEPIEHNPKGVVVNGEISEELITDPGEKAAFDSTQKELKDESEKK